MRCSHGRCGIHLGSTCLALTGKARTSVRLIPLVDTVRGFLAAIPYDIVIGNDDCATEIRRCFMRAHRVGSQAISSSRRPDQVEVEWTIIPLILRS